MVLRGITWTRRFVLWRLGEESSDDVQRAGMQKLSAPVHARVQGPDLARRVCRVRRLLAAVGNGVVVAGLARMG